MMRLQILGDPALMRQLEHVCPYCTRQICVSTTSRCPYQDPTRVGKRRTL